MFMSKIEPNEEHNACRSVEFTSTTSPIAHVLSSAEPVGHWSGFDSYAYVGNDPVNRADPTGLQQQPPPLPPPEEIVVTGRRLRAVCHAGWVQVGNVCVDRVDLGSIRFGPNSFTFTTPGAPDIGPGVDCTANGNVVTCSLGNEAEQCQSQSGPVIFGTLFAEGYLIRGGGLSAGGYYDVGTGEGGLMGSGESTAVPYSGSFGWGGSAGTQFGIATNRSSLAGDYSVIGIGIGPYSVNYAFARGNIFSPIALSGGPAANLMPAPPWFASFHYAQGTTNLLTVRGGC